MSLTAAYKLIFKGIPEGARFLLEGSKSYTNRALIMAALTSGTVRIKRPSLSNDSKVLIAALQKFGVGFADSGEDLLVTGRALKDFLPYQGTIDIGPAGTSMRFLIALTACIPGAEVELRGSERMHERPVEDLVSALQSLGAQIEYRGKPGCPPLLIKGRHLTGGSVSLNGTISSQFFTALLLVGPLMEAGLKISVQGQQISKSYIDMTLQGLEAFGIKTINQDYTAYIIEPGQHYQCADYLIEGDASGASYLFGLAALAAGSITVENISFNSKQGDAQFPKLLEEMGCQIAESRNSEDLPCITVTGSQELRAITADMEQMPDTAQTLAVIAACAHGKTYISGLSTLRNKETDRISALHVELKKLGIDSIEYPEALEVCGGALKPASIDTYDDHRMAMSFAILATRVKDLVIKDPGVVSKSFPGFWQAMRSFGIEVQA